MRTQFRFFLFAGVILSLYFNFYICNAQSISFGNQKYNYINCNSSELDSAITSTEDEILEIVPFGQPSVHIKIDTLKKEQVDVTFNLGDQCKNVTVIQIIFHSHNIEFQMKENVDFVLNCLEWKLTVINKHILANSGFIETYWICQDRE